MPSTTHHYVPRGSARLSWMLGRWSGPRTGPSRVTNGPFDGAIRGVCSAVMRLTEGWHRGVGR